MGRRKNESAIHYVDNEKFLNALKDHRKACEEAEQQGDELPRVSEYVGECFYKIAHRLSLHRHFARYPFREDMVGDAVENCLRYINNFDTERSNPFAYFSQVAYFAFLRKIKLEKKMLYTRFKMSEQYPIDDPDMQSGAPANDFDNYRSQFIEDYEKARAEEKSKAKKKAASK